MNTVIKLILLIVATLSLTLCAAVKQASVKEKEEVDIVHYTHEVYSVYYAVDLDGTEDVSLPAGSYVALWDHKTNSVTGLIPINCSAEQLVKIADVPFILVTYEKFQQKIISTTLLCIASA